MTPDEIVGVVGLLAVAFGRETSAETFEVYEAALEDLEIPDARGLVLGLLRVMEWWPAPAVLRREILRASGLLPLDDDEAWSCALAYARNPDRVDPPAEVREAIHAIGGPWSILHEVRGVVHAQFREAYRSAKARATQDAMGRSWEGVPLTPGSQVGLTHGGRGRGLGRGDHPAPGGAEG